MRPTLCGVNLVPTESKECKELSIVTNCKQNKKEEIGVSEQ